MNATQRAAMAWKMVRSDLGRRAANEEWISELWDFVFAEGREPDDAEMAGMRQSAAEKWAELPGWPFPAARQAIINKFEKMRKAAYERAGGDAA